MIQKLNLPLDKKSVSKLRAGDEALLSGPLLVARDAAHRRFAEEYKKYKKFPVSLKNETIYYAGPTPPRPGAVIGSCGPTTSSRMDRFTEPLLKAGLIAMIGKGTRASYIEKGIAKNRAVYFIAPGGAGAFLAKRILKKEVAAYPDLGPEAVYRIWVKNFPVIVAIDARGRNIYESK